MLLHLGLLKMARYPVGGLYPGGMVGSGRSNETLFRCGFGYAPRLVWRGSESEYIGQGQFVRSSPPKGRELNVPHPQFSCPTRRNVNRLLARKQCSKCVALPSSILAVLNSLFL